MKYLKKIGIGVIALAVAVGASIVGQLYIDTSTRAANTLNGDNEVITIKTTDGQPVNANFTPHAYSGDGNVVLFSSPNATNLQDAGGSGGMYVYNIKDDTTIRVDVSTNGTLPNGSLFGANSKFLLSETGRYVSFGSFATNLVDGATTNQGMNYKRDIQTGTTSLIGGYYGNGLSQNWDRNLGITNDGRFSLLASRYKGNNTYPYNYGIVLGEEINGAYNWTMIEEEGGSGLGSGNSSAIAGGLSCDGAFAAYGANRSVRLADLRTGNITKITAGSHASVSPIISCNGRYILYATTNRTEITPTPPGNEF